MFWTKLNYTNKASREREKEKKFNDAKDWTRRIANKGTDIRTIQVLKMMSTDECFSVFLSLKFVMRMLESFFGTNFSFFYCKKKTSRVELLKGIIVVCFRCLLLEQWVQWQTAHRKLCHRRRWVSDCIFFLFFDRICQRFVSWKIWYFLPVIMRW